MKIVSLGTPATPCLVCLPPAMNLRLLCAALAFTCTSLSPLFAIPREANGVWARGGDYDLDVFPYRGVEVSVAWRDLEPKEGQFDWSVLDEPLAQAAKDGLYTFSSLGVGFEGPDWLYELGIPKVTTDHRSRKGPYPYYLDGRYVTRYHRVIDAYARHLRSLPREVGKWLLFVQVKTGATGDEAPYKGQPTPEEYAISKEQWLAFRLAAFEQFHKSFQRGPGPVVPLLFNALMDDAPALQWVRAHVDGGWGHKLGGYGQGYQLSGEAERISSFLPPLLDPPADEPEFFTRCEMDQSWQRPRFAPNIRMGFYWTALSALHAGLSTWNITQSARNWCREHDYWEFAHFFNKYAGQTRSETATGAFCALRRGLDAADTKAFPEDRFGKANRSNRDRYLALCQAFADHGAKMDDVDGVLRGQVFQRREEKGMNDVGFNIFPGNYERFLHQIDPDETSVGWWRVGGPVTADSPVYGRFARAFEHAAKKDQLLFDIKDSFFSGKPLAGAYPVTVTVRYYDRGRGKWALQYDSVGEVSRTAFEVTKSDTGRWLTKQVTLTDANFGNRGPRGADLLLVNLDDEDDLFHLVEVTRQLPAQ